MKKTLQSALMFAATSAILLSPINGIANDGSDGLGLTDEPTTELTGLDGESGLTGEPGLETTTTDEGLLGDPSNENAFDNSLSSPDSDTTPISTSSTEEEDPAFELTEAPETQPDDLEEDTDDLEDDEPKLELEEADDKYLKEIDKLPKTGFASSTSLLVGLGAGVSGMVKGILGKRKEEK